MLVLNVIQDTFSLHFFLPKICLKSSEEWKLTFVSLLLSPSIQSPLFFFFFILTTSLLQALTWISVLFSLPLTPGDMHKIPGMLAPRERERRIEANTKKGKKRRRKEFLPWNYYRQEWEWHENVSFPSWRAFSKVGERERDSQSWWAEREEGDSYNNCNITTINIWGKVVVKHFVCCWITGRRKWNDWEKPGKDRQTFVFGEMGKFPNDICIKTIKLKTCAQIYAKFMFLEVCFNCSSFSFLLKRCIEN